MTAFSRDVPAETGLINCRFAIHHLPGIDEVEKCLIEIRDAGRRTGCAFWIFDLVRPRHLRTAVEIRECSHLTRRRCFGSTRPTRSSPLTPIPSWRAWSTAYSGGPPSAPRTRASCRFTRPFGDPEPDCEVVTGGTPQARL